MEVRTLMSLILAAGAARFVWLVWSGHRHAIVKSAALWSKGYRRDSQPGLYRSFMILHAVTAAGLIGLALGVVFGLLPISN
ncbi:MAG: hypothetical protein JWM33_126 [Caulobacteraceae bacterium]|nr:hypothetical protein [Caulobacteraceae bacterium]